MTFTDTLQSLPDLQAEKLKSQLSSLTSEQLAALRLSYRYRLRQAGMRSTGWLNLILGGLTLWLAFNSSHSATFQSNGTLQILVLIQGAFGLGIVIASLWSLASPVPIVSIMWAAIFGFAAVWNIFIFISTRNVIWGVLGLFQVWWAIQRVQLYLKDAKTVWPDSDTLALYDNLQRAMQSLRLTPDDDPDYIQFQQKRIYWQGFLLQDRAVLASQRGITLLLAERSKTLFTFGYGKNLFKPRITGNISLDGIRFPNVTFPQSTLERYNHWRGLPAAKSAEWLGAFADNNRKRRPMRIAVMLLLASPILLMFGTVLALVIMVLSYGH